MSDRPTPDTNAASWVETNQANALTLASFSSELERERDEARELARELRDALQRLINNGHAYDCSLIHYINGACDCGLHAASILIARAKEVLP